MRKGGLALLWLCVLTLTGCSARKDCSDLQHCVLLDKGPSKLLLGIVKREWGGVFGPHGYVGYEHVGYWAALEGGGPTYVNPRFQDNPSEFHCVGTITLDQEQNQVTVSMHRVVSKLGEPERTVPHPANGTYTINSRRKAEAYELWF